MMKQNKESEAITNNVSEQVDKKSKYPLERMENRLVKEIEKKQTRCIFVADYGKNLIKAYNPTINKVEVYNDDDLINLNFSGIQSGDLFVMEECHLRASELNSLSHHLTIERLLHMKKVAEQKNIEIRLFPQSKTPMARKLNGYPEKDDKNDEVDVISIYKFLQHYPKYYKTCQKFNPRSHEEYKKETEIYHKTLQELNKDLNIARTLGYGALGKTYTNYHDSIIDWILKNKDEIALRVEKVAPLSTLYLSYNKTKYEKGIRQLNSFANKPYKLYMTVAFFLRPDGTARMNPICDKLPFFEYIKYWYLSLKPYHHRGGLAGSNYKRHNRSSDNDLPKKFDPFASYENHDRMKIARSASDKNYRNAIRVIRQMIIEDPNIDTKDSRPQ